MPDTEKTTLSMKEVMALRGINRTRVNVLIGQKRLTPSKDNKGRLQFEAAQVKALELQPRGVHLKKRRTQAQIREAALSGAGEGESI